MAASMLSRTFVNIRGICAECSFLKHGSVLTDTPWCSSLTVVRWKHYNPKYRKERAQKVRKIELPDFQKLRREANMSPEEQRAHFKREGIQPPRHHQERDLVLSSTSTVFEPYVPPEGDGVASLISGKGAKQRLTELEKKGKSFLQLRKIKQFESFDNTEFSNTALDIYLETHKLLENADDNEDRLHDLVTEKAYPEMVHRLKKKTFRWKYIEALEPSRLVHVRTVDMLSKENLYAQVTVRFHTKQTMAIYDRFGRLMFGSEHIIKDILEYIVFEKHVSDENSMWRIHGKVIPEWMPTRQTVERTMRMPNFSSIEEDDAEESKKAKSDEQSAATA